MKKSTIIISCTVIVVCFILMLSLCCISSQKNSAYAINRTIIKENLVCYQGSAYYHHINVFLRTDSKVSSYSSKYYTTGSELLLEFNRGKHNSGIGLSAHNHDIAGWVIFQLVNSSNVVVSSKKFYQAYKNEPSFLTWLSRCYIKTKSPEKAWCLYLDATNTEAANDVLQIIAADCYEDGFYLFAMRSYDILSKSFQLVV